MFEDDVIALMDRWVEVMNALPRPHRRRVGHSRAFHTFTNAILTWQKLNDPGFIFRYMETHNVQS